MSIEKINKSNDGKEIKREIHPELKEGEVFLTNASYDRMPLILNNRTDIRSSWDSIGWKTKRKGSTAFDIYGKVVDGMFPVFVQREELEKAGIDPDTL